MADQAREADVDVDLFRVVCSAISHEQQKHSEGNLSLAVLCAELSMQASLWQDTYCDFPCDSESVSSVFRSDTSWSRAPSVAVSAASSTPPSSSPASIRGSVSPPRAALTAPR